MAHEKNQSGGRTRRGDWLDHGLQVLAAEGATGLTIARMCELLQRTKGAFYHHFASVDAYHHALLGHWQERLTAAPIEVAESGMSDGEKRGRLSEAVGLLDSRLDQAVRAWAGKNRAAAQHLAIVDGLRIAYLEALHRSAHRLPPAAARVLAQVEYSAFVGAQQLFDDMATPEAKTVQRALARALALLATEMTE